MARDYADVLNGTFGDETIAPVAALSFIFGGSVRLLDEPDTKIERRIAMYPCITEPDLMEFAQGLVCVLAWELNSIDGVTAIPLLIKAPENEWIAEDSSFTPETFTLDGLGEDTIITAALRRDEIGFNISLAITTEIEHVEDLTFELRANGEHELLAAILDAAGRIGRWLDVGTDELTIENEAKPADKVPAIEWLKAVFAWHCTTLDDALNERPFSVSSVSFQRLTAAPDLGRMVIKGAALYMLWFQEIDLSVLDALRAFPRWQANAGPLARSIVELGKIREALELVNTAVEEAPEFAGNWLVLARMYSAVQQPTLAIETLQSAIEQHQDYAPLLMQYGDALMNYADQNTPLETVIFIEEDLEPASAFECIAAYERAARLLNGELQAMAYVQLIAAQARYQPAKLWQSFEVLATSDHTGVYTELALNAVAAQDEIVAAVSSLQKAVYSNPESSRIWRNLAYAQYLAGDHGGAAAAIREALDRVKDSRSRGEYELLSLYIQDPAVEEELAEVADNLSAGGSVTDRALELLEWIVSEAPHYIEGYLLLGRAYEANAETSTALEVLLDAEQNLEVDAEIYVAIIDLLLEVGEETVALDYVSKAIDVFPRHVTLLVRAALVMDGIGDRDGAKTFLRQAHNIAPYHREIMRVSTIFHNLDDE